MLRKSLLLGSAAALATAPLAYFQMVCNQEKEHAGKPKQFNTVFDPDKTDAVDIPMMFACKGTKSCIDLRFQKGQYELSNSSMPCAMEKFWKFVQNPTKIHEEKKITFLEQQEIFLAVLILWWLYRKFDSSQRQSDILNQSLYSS